MELELNVLHETENNNNQPRRFLKNPENREGLSLFERNGRIQRKRAAVHLDKGDPDSFLFNQDEPMAKNKQPKPMEKCTPKPEPSFHSKKKPITTGNLQITKTPAEDEEEEYDRFCFTCGYVNNCTDACFTKDDQGNLVNNFCIEF